jgi:hypothetical protein
MIADDFDSRTFANMTVALDRVCERRADGENHRLRKLVARHIVRCAKSGHTGLAALTQAGKRALSRAPRL